MIEIKTKILVLQEYESEKREETNCEEDYYIRIIWIQVNLIPNIGRT